MAIQEYTDEINEITLTTTKRAIVLTDDNKIDDSILEGPINIIATNKVVVGTQNQINTYIADNNLEYAEE